MSTLKPSEDIRRNELRQIAVNSWGTAAIFIMRADKCEKQLKIAALIGFTLPVLIGVLVIALGADWKYLNTALTIVGVVSAFQAIYNAILIFYGCERQLREYLDSASTNKSIAIRAFELSQNIQAPPDEFTAAYLLLKGENRNQENNDERKNISDKDRRIAGRNGLFQFSQKCGSCKKIPTSTAAKSDGSTCNFCGNF